MKSQSTVIQGSFPGGRPLGPALVRRPPQPGKPVIQPAGSTQAMQIDPALLNLGASLGKSLPEAVQRKMETFFGTNFSDVRVHVGPQASSIGALAFTLGSNIYFASGQYDPHSVRGQQVLGHELTHVIQQRSGRVRNPQGFGIAVVQDHALEAEADRLGMRAAAQPLPAGHPSPAGAGMVQPKRVQSLAHGPVQPKLASSQPGTRPVAPHVQAALAAVGQPKAAWSPPVTRPTVQPKADGHKLVVGTYLHRGLGAASLPAEAAGHTFVAVEGPGGRREAYGFSPADTHRYDFQKDIGKLRTGVPGAVQRDDGAFAKPGVKTRTYDVSPEQARAALTKVAEYKTRPPAFSLARQDCGQFAAEVLKAAKIDDFAGPGVKRPAEMYRQVQAPVASGAQVKTPGLPSAGQRPLAPHVQAAVSAVGQPKLPNAQPGGRPLAPHVQAAVGDSLQPKLSVARQSGRTLVPGQVEKRLSTPISHTWVGNEVIQRMEAQVHIGGTVTPLESDPPWLEKFISTAAKIDGLGRFVKASREAKKSGERLLQGYEYQAKVACELGDKLKAMEEPFIGATKELRYIDLVTVDGEWIECKAYSTDSSNACIMKEFFFKHGIIIQLAVE
jgi:hypothetical protein